MEESVPRSEVVSLKLLSVQQQYLQLEVQSLCWAAPVTDTQTDHWTHRCAESAGTERRYSTGSLPSCIQPRSCLTAPSHSAPCAADSQTPARRRRRRRSTASAWDNTTFSLLKATWTNKQTVGQQTNKPAPPAARNIRHYGFMLFTPWSELSICMWQQKTRFIRPADIFPIFSCLVLLSQTQTQHPGLSWQEWNLPWYLTCCVLCCCNTQLFVFLSACWFSPNAHLRDVFSRRCAANVLFFTVTSASCCAINPTALSHY